MNRCGQERVDPWQFPSGRPVTAGVRRNVSDSLPPGSWLVTACRPVDDSGTSRVPRAPHATGPLDTTAAPGCSAGGNRLDRLRRRVERQRQPAAIAAGNCEFPEPHPSSWRPRDEVARRPGARSRDIIPTDHASVLLHVVAAKVLIQLSQAGQVGFEGGHERLGGNLSRHGRHDQLLDVRPLMKRLFPIVQSEVRITCQSRLAPRLKEHQPVVRPNLESLSDQRCLRCGSGRSRNESSARCR